MPKYTQQQLEERYQRLPESLKDAMFSVDIAKRMVEVSHKFGLSIEKSGFLAEETGYVVLGLVRPDEFVSALVDQLEINRETAEKIALEINHQVFYPLREALKKAHFIDIREEDFHKESLIPKPAPISTPPQTPAPSAPASATAVPLKTPVGKPASTLSEIEKTGFAPIPEPQKTELPQDRANIINPALDPALARKSWVDRETLRPDTRSNAGIIAIPQQDKDFKSGVKPFPADAKSLADKPAENKIPPVIPSRAPFTRPVPEKPVMEKTEDGLLKPVMPPQPKMQPIDLRNMPTPAPMSTPVPILRPVPTRELRLEETPSSEKKEEATPVRRAPIDVPMPKPRNIFFNPVPEPAKPKPKTEAPAAAPKPSPAPRNGGADPYREPIE